MSALSEFIRELKLRQEVLDDAHGRDDFAISLVCDPQGVTKHGPHRVWTRQDRNRFECDIAISEAELQGTRDSELYAMPIFNSRMGTRVDRIVERCKRYPLRPWYDRAMAEAQTNGTYGTVSPLIIRANQRYEALLAAYREEIEWDGVQRRFDRAVADLELHVVADAHIGKRGAPDSVAPGPSEELAQIERDAAARLAEELDRMGRAQEAIRQRELLERQFEAVVDCAWRQGGETKAEFLARWESEFRTLGQLLAEGGCAQRLVSLAEQTRSSTEPAWRLALLLLKTAMEGTAAVSIQDSLRMAWNNQFLNATRDALHEIGTRLCISQPTLRTSVRPGESGSHSPAPRVPEPPPSDPIPWDEAGDRRTLVFHEDRVELCGVDICSGRRSGTKRGILDLLAKKEETGRFVSYNLDQLTESLKPKGGQGTVLGAIRDLRARITADLRSRANISCSRMEVILSGGSGYRFADNLTVRYGGLPASVDADETPSDADEPAVEVRDDVSDGPATVRRAWILERLGSGERLQAPAVAKQLKCSVKTAQRDLTALREQGKIEYVGDSRKGTYRLCQPQSPDG